jgi:hypothetical protein
MSAAHKIAVINAIALEIKRRYTLREIDGYLAEFNIDTPIPICELQRCEGQLCQGNAVTSQHRIFHPFENS